MKYDKEGDLRKRKKHLAIVLKENRGAKFKWIGNKKDHFTIDKNYYFISETGMYISKSNVRFSIYLEGISTPLNHDYIERIEEQRLVTNPDTQETLKVKVTTIKGLKYDSKLINMLLNTKLAEQFTRTRSDISIMVLLILSVAILAVAIISIGVQFA